MAKKEVEAEVIVCLPEMQDALATGGRRRTCVRGTRHAAV